MRMKIKTLKEVIQFKNGKKRPSIDGNIPVYGGNGILGYANNSNYERCIIIGRVGAYCGSVYLEDNKCWVSDNAIAAQPLGENDIRFLYYLLKCLRLNERHIGTSQPLLTQEILNKIECVVPSPPEQKRIAALLGSFDDKISANKMINDNLAYVVANTDCYEDLRINLLTGIVHIPRSDGRFHNLYTERKKLVKGFPESEIAAFIRENQIDPMESIYRYTDNTKMEREAIISWVAQHGYIAEIEIIYPALAQYLGEYVFDCGGLSDELTKYFKQYRLMKVTNQITPEFLAQVEQNAQKLPYTHLETRDSAILRIPDKKDAFLYWIDALGVEYLSYIAILAKKKGLSIHVDIAYVELPTITSINKGFFEKWAGSKKEKEPRLDEIKHKEEGGYFYRPGQAPVHLASELEVIRKSIDRAATELAMHTCKTFVIASDHGASRLAVIHHQEEKYDTDTKGEHSGRCCKEFADADLPQAICENGYLVLADYGRFKNSRAANVEVHGGASLEEVIVPIITLSLKKQCDLIIELLNADEVYCDRRLGTTIQLYISDADNTQSISVVIDEKRYAAKGSDKTHYEVNLYDMRRAKKNVSAAIYDGDDLIGTVHFDIKGKMATVNNDFDDLF